MTASFDPATGMRLVTLAILCLMPRPAFAQGSIDSNEVAVLRVVLQRQGNDTSIVVGSAPDTTAVCNDGSERTCIPASLAPAYASAIENYAHRNRSGPAPDALLRTLGRPARARALPGLRLGERRDAPVETRTERLGRRRAHRLMDHVTGLERTHLWIVPMLLQR